MAWLGLLIRDGPKILKKTVVKFDNSFQTVGDMVAQTVKRDQKLLSVLGHCEDPEKIQHAAPVPVGLPIEVPCRSLVSQFDVKYIEVKLQCQSTEGRDINTPQASLKTGLDIC